MCGVDDFALRRRQRYATILIDAETRRRVDVLPDRSADTLEAWLRAHPGVQVVCRDGSAAYAEAVRRALPDAVQVADRWHLWHNLAEAVRHEVAAHSTCWAKAGPPPTDGPRAQTTRQRWQQIHDLLDQGVGLLDCARRLNLALNAVKRYARVPEPDRLIRAPAFRPTLVDPYRDYLRRRRAEEPAVSVLRLFREITEQGYTGSHNLLVRYINQGRLEGDKPAISPRALTRLLLTRPDALTDAQRNRLGELTATCPEMTLLASLIRDFAALLDPADGNDDHLTTWITNARTADLPHLHAFTRGLAPAAASAQQFTRGSPTNSPRRNDRAHLRDSTRAKPPSIRAPRASNSERHRSGSTLGHTATGRSSRVHTTPEDHRWPLSFPDRLPLSPATQPQPTRPQRSQKSGWSTNARRAGEIKARKMI